MLAAVQAVAPNAAAKFGEPDLKLDLRSPQRQICARGVRKQVTDRY